MDPCTKQLRNEYDYERTKLVTLCEKWQDILERRGKYRYSDDTKGAILAVIGQTRLLVNKKMKQFEGLLVEREQSGGDGRPITESDLRGFWEMVMIEVDIMTAKFDDLKDVTLDGGVEEKPAWAIPPAHRSPSKVKHQPHSREASNS